MEFRFADYCFDSASLMLFRRGEAQALRNNEARLLAYFLSHPRQVLSKEQILDTVWAGKVVSEQAVFQAVSNLRQQFGEAAIKTFPKKGYQWQIPLDTGASDAATENPVAPLEQVLPGARMLMGKLLALLFLALALLAAVVLYQRWLPAPSGPAAVPVPIVLRVLEQPATATPPVQQALLARLQREPLLQVRAAPAELSEAQLLAAPEHYARALLGPSPAQGAGPAGLLLSGRLQQHGKLQVLSFTLQGRENRWTGHLSGRTPDELLEQLVGLLRRVAPMRVLWESKDQRLVNAQLQLLHNEEPQSLPILRTLVSNLVAIGDAQGAQLRAGELQQLAQQAQDLPHQVHALHALARLAIEAGQAEQARSQLDQALALGRQLQDSSLQAQTLERYFPIYYLQHDFERLEESLLQALRLAHTAQDPAREADLLFVLTIASYKFHHVTKQSYYFEQTRARFDQLKLPAESYAELEFFAGLNSADPQQAERFYKAALQRFAPGQAAPAKERALQELVQLYLGQGRAAEALALVQAEPQPGAAELLLLARIHGQQPGQQAQALGQAEAAFKAANLSGDYLSALDAALFLAERQRAANAPTQAQPYRDFIAKQATPLWTRQNQPALAALEKR